MTRLKMENIQYVKEYTRNGRPYAWAARIGGRPTDMRLYENYKRNSTSPNYYPLTQLPKTIQKFVATHVVKVYQEIDEFVQYIYK